VVVYYDVSKFNWKSQTCVFLFENKYGYKLKISPNLNSVPRVIRLEFLKLLWKNPIVSMDKKRQQPIITMTNNKFCGNILNRLLFKWKCLLNSFLQLYHGREQIIFWWDDDTCFVLKQPAELDFYRASLCICSLVYSNTFSLSYIHVQIKHFLLHQHFPATNHKLSL
jgi:hypothetical protein